MAQAQDNGSKQAAGQHVEEPPRGQSAQELLDAWYASVQQELEGADADVCVWDPEARWTISAATQQQADEVCDRLAKIVADELAL